MAIANSTQSETEERTVLIVDDNPTNLGVVTKYLEGSGYRILVARTGETALKRAQYAKPNIILLDVMMPGIDGFETCQRLKSNEETRDIPVIFMTALADTEDKVRGFQAGAVDYVTKPLQHEEVLARVTTHLRIRELAQSLQERNARLQHVTDELRKANAVLSKRAIQLETSSQVGQHVTSILDLNELLTAVVGLIQSMFGYYFVGIWLLDDKRETIVLQAGTGNESGKLLTQGLHIPLDITDSLIVWVCETGHSYMADDVTADSKYRPIADLPDTRSELALPLRIGLDIIGVLDIHSHQVGAFDFEDRTVLQTLANQIAIAIRNARLYESEKELRRIEEQRVHDLAELNATKDKFFSIVSHDLRGPFTALLAGTQVMLKIIDQLSKEQIEERLQRIFNSTKVAADLLENLLTWARMQMGTINFAASRVNLANLNSRTVRLYADSAEQKQVHLNTNIPPEIHVYADGHMLATVLRNLISNALKFTPSNGIVTVSADNQGPNIPNGFVEVSVTDTGVGINNDNLEKLFRVDVHHTTTGTADEKGAGLGLIICKEMVEKNGGKIWITSQPKSGTTVKFTVPVSY